MVFVGRPSAVSRLQFRCPKSTNAGFSLSTDIISFCVYQCPRLKDIERCFIWTLEGCAVSIPADKNKLELLQVGWHEGWYNNPMLGGSVHADLIPDL